MDYKALYEKEVEKTKQLEKEIIKLKKQIDKLKKNAYGAGRKPKVTKQQKERIKNLYATGEYSMDKLAEEFNLSKGTIFNIIKE